MARRGSRFCGADPHLAVQFLLCKLADSANAFRFFARPFLRGLFIVLPKSHFPEHAFLLQFLF